MEEPDEARPELPPYAQREEGKDFFLGPVTENDRMAALFFTAVTANGAVEQVDLNRMPSVTEAEATALVQAALDAGQQSGSTGSFRFAAQENREGKLVYVFLDGSARRQSVLRVAVLSLLAGAIGWGLMLLLVVLLSKRAIRPIAANMERQRQFVTDAGHELKTPLAIIQANTEAMELIQGENKWSRNIKAQVARLTDLTRNLLTLARAEETPSAGAIHDVDLSQLTQQQLQMFLPSMELKSITCQPQIAPDQTIQANGQQIGNLLSILLDNAVKYTPEGGKIRLQLGKEGKHVQLTLENDCEQLPQCEPEQLFDRFYRGDSARTQKSGGFGIGLSAARVIAQQNRAELTARYEGQTRIAFVCRFPL